MTASLATAIEHGPAAPRRRELRGRDARTTTPVVGGAALAIGLVFAAAGAVLVQFGRGAVGPAGGAGDPRGGSRW